MSIPSSCRFFFSLVSKNTLETHLIHQLQHAHARKIMTIRLGNVFFSLVSIDVFK